MRFALIGQPNCGKSTLFNQVAGYKAETGNFSGTTITFTESSVRVLGDIVHLVDLPGTYSLAGTNQAEREVVRYLANHDVDVIINVVDASHLVQGLTLTLELMELGIPMVVAMNMLDEAARKGLKVDGPKLQQILSLEVLPLIANKGRGVKNVFTSAHHASYAAKPPHRMTYDAQIEEAISHLSDLVKQNGRISPGGASIKLLEGDFTSFSGIVNGEDGEYHKKIIQAKNQITDECYENTAWYFSDARYERSKAIVDEVVLDGEKKYSWIDRLDDYLLHPIWGYVGLVIILWLFFQVVYRFGSLIEEPLLAVFDSLAFWLEANLTFSNLVTEILVGIVQGVAGGVAIVLPYLTPFLIGLGFLEDVGYLPRLAFLMDSLMNKIGLHGKAIVPFILGYGCNVPAVMATRMMDNHRDKFLSATLATLVPCAARLAVVFGLVAFYLGPEVALLIYVFNLFVIAVTGRLLSGLMPEKSAGLILEIPPYRTPSFKAVLQKAWFRGKEFIYEAWPLLIAGSIVLAILDHFNLAVIFNWIARPVTWVLGLPDAVGVPLIFGILRKELSLIMLRQALHVTDFSNALTPEQMISFTVFVVFYIPCLATMAVLRKELGNRDMFLISLITIVIAVIAGLVARGIYLIYV